MPRITMFHTSTCPFCVHAEALLRRKGYGIQDKINIEFSPAVRDAMIMQTGRRTVPQIFIAGQHIGGFDDLAALDRAGRLDALLQGNESVQP